MRFFVQSGTIGIRCQKGCWWHNWAQIKPLINIITLKTQIVEICKSRGMAIFPPGLVGADEARRERAASGVFEREEPVPYYNTIFEFLIIAIMALPKPIGSIWQRQFAGNEEFLISYFINFIERGQVKSGSDGERRPDSAWKLNSVARSHDWYKFLNAKLIF